MKETGIRRYISWYEKKGDDLIADEDIKNIDLKELQSLFDVPEENPMYDSWKIEKEHIETLQEHINHKINITEYEYFVEAEEINE